jgi:hypothetical protein
MEKLAAPQATPRVGGGVNRLGKILFNLHSVTLAGEHCLSAGLGNYNSRKSRFLISEIVVRNKLCQNQYFEYKFEKGTT